MKIETGRGPLKFFEAHWSAGYLVLGILLFYALTPILVDTFLGRDTHLQLLAQLALLAAASIGIGFAIPVLDPLFRPNAPRLKISGDLVHTVIWGSFIVFAVTVVATAEHIPLFSALNGATAQELSDQRGNFLKTRTGWEALLNYINALYTGAILPFSLASLFLYNRGMRWIALLAFVIYCELSLEKALYLRAILPILYLTLTRRLWDYPRAVLLIIAMLGLMYANTELSRGSDQFEVSTAESAEGMPVQIDPMVVSAIDVPPASFFSPYYQPTSTVDFLVWRSVAVPVFTAADALSVFESDFDNEPLMGATSTLISSVFGLERVPFEALVHGRQFGGTEASYIGRSNSVFFTEAFVNFGWIGVTAFGLFIGQSLRWFRKSSDMAFRAIWPLYVLNVYQSGLIGNLFSNGFAIFFAIGLFVELTYHERASRSAPVGTSSAESRGPERAVQ
ncbi:MAG: hypothetical protein IBJ07_16380 [Rhizobiaceae bacterium]|nr:hypothetical protein [Rhizobiaceae bacterium]